MTKNFSSIASDPRPTSSRIRQHFQAEEDDSKSVWWITVFELRQGSGRACIFDRGAEDCEESA